MTGKTPDEELAGAVERLTNLADSMDAADSENGYFVPSLDSTAIRTVLSALQGEGWKAALCSPEAVEVVARATYERQRTQAGQRLWWSPNAWPAWEDLPIQERAERLEQAEAALSAIAQMGEKAG